MIRIFYSRLSSREFRSYYVWFPPLPGEPFSRYTLSYTPEAALSLGTANRTMPVLTDGDIRALSNPHEFVEITPGYETGTNPPPPSPTPKTNHKIGAPKGKLP